MEGQTEAPDVLAFQPSPIEYYVTPLPFPGGHVASMLERVWREGDTRRCRLCPLCTAIHSRSVCAILVDQPLDGRLAPTFSAHGLHLVAGPLSADTPGPEPGAYRPDGLGRLGE